MRPYLLHEARSAFAERSPSSFAVLVTYPTEQAWHVVLDKKTAIPVFECEAAQQALEMADRFAQLSDLEFMANLLLSGSSKVYCQTEKPSWVASDGLDLFPPSLFHSSSRIAIDDAMESAIHSDGDTKRQWAIWEAATTASPCLAKRPQSILFSFETEEPVRDESGWASEKTEVFVAASLQWSEGGQILGADIRVLNAENRRLRQWLQDIDHSPADEAWLEGDESAGEWSEIVKVMPLLAARLPGYVYQGGPVLEYIAKHHPELVIADEQGVPLPIRIASIASDQVVDEQGMREDQAALAAVFLSDQLETIARLPIIEAQHKTGKLRGQQFGDQCFETLATYADDVVLEVLGKPTVPGVVNYRIWSNSECVVDAAPGSLVACNPARTLVGGSAAGLESPAAVDRAQLADLVLDVALAPFDPQSNFLLPERVEQFLASPVGERLHAGVLERKGDRTVAAEQPLRGASNSESVLAAHP